MIIVFSDLDGTLLDHHTYRYDESQEGMRILEENGIPLVTVSSKTFSEMKEIQAELGLSAPFIFENGNGIAYPETQGNYTPEIPGLPVSELRKKVGLLNEILKTGVRLITDMTADEIVELTGLSHERALHAARRMSSLPFIIDTERVIDVRELDSINAELNPEGVSMTKGGRFYHFSSNRADKGTAMDQVARYFQQKEKGARVTTCGIGDSENDIPMLAAADIPVLVRKYDGSAIETGLKGIHVTDDPGPAGFTEAVKKIIIPAFIKCDN